MVLGITPSTKFVYSLTSTGNYPVDVFYGDGVSFFAQKKVGRLVADEDIIIKILWRHKEYQMCFDNQTIGYAMEQAQ